MENVKLVFSCVLVLSLNIVCGQYAQSPCPDIFDYESDGEEIYGKIVLRPSAPVSMIVVRTNFTIATQLYSDYVGRIEPEDFNRLLHDYNKGLPARYRVHFPVKSPLPKLTALTVNNDVLCYGSPDVPGPGTQHVTTISLRHTTYLKGGAMSPSFQPHHQSTPDFNALMQQLGEDGQVFMFNNIDNNPNWNKGNSLYYYIVNNPEPPRRKVSTNSRPMNSVPFEQDYYTTEDRPVNSKRQQSQPRPMPSPARPMRPTMTHMPDLTVEPDDQLNEACGVITDEKNFVPLIFGGQNYSRGELPWLVAIFRKKNLGDAAFTCGGTLITHRHILTAAHCKAPVDEIFVRVGVHNLNDWTDDSIVTSKIIATNIHHAYDGSTLKNDIMMITMEKSVPFNSYIRPACLWSGDTDLNKILGSFGVVAGWGNQGKGAMSEIPVRVEVPVVSTNECRASRVEFHALTSANTICAGHRNGQGPCNGDSGSGLYFHDNGKWRLRGIVSLALGKPGGFCDLQEYVLLTDTAQYLPWIRSIISES